MGPGKAGDEQRLLEAQGAMVRGFPSRAGEAGGNELSDILDQLEGSIDPRMTSQLGVYPLPDLRADGIWNEEPILRA